MISVKEYLERKGYRWRPLGDKWVTNSPFKPGGDSHPSFVLYPSGVFKCYATGKAGNAVTLSRYFNDSLAGIGDWVPKPTPKVKLNGFIPEKYTNLSVREGERVREYARRRGIQSGYIPGVWVLGGKRMPALIFEHVDSDFKLVGAKFRMIDGTGGNRMRTLGTVGFYVLDARTDKPPTTYLIESETSANSLWEYIKQSNISAVVVSTGSVGAVPKTLPFNYPLKKIIDYDGNPALFKSRIDKYKHLGGTNIKMILPKGEDINSLYVKDELWKIDFLL